MTPVLTAIVSDLHLGSLSGADLARAPDVRERLVGALADADHVIVLGDLLELRERPVGAVLELARPVVEALGQASAGGRLTLVPGNHDHTLAAPFLERQRLSGGELGTEQEWPVAAGDGDGLAGRLAEWMPETELVLAYPGFRPRPDIYVTHGHYLDAHLTMPRLEAIIASIMGRLTGRGTRPRSATAHEAVLAPIYAFADSLAQGASPGALRSGTSASRGVWNRINGERRGAGGFLLGRAAIPGAVALLNAAGMGPFTSNITGDELRRSGLAAMARVVAGMGVEADHVVFGHTHRAGPLPEDDEREWALPGGGRLHNSGSWFREPVFLGHDPQASPYFPGTVVFLRDERPPELERALEGLALPAPASAA